MNEYILYLDETEIKEKKLFLVGGIVIEGSQLGALDEQIKKVKQCIWDEEYIQENSPILHCTDITTIKNHRYDRGAINATIKNKNFLEVFSSKSPDAIADIYKKMMRKLCETIKVINPVIIGCCINTSNYTYLYGDSKPKDYFIEVSLQNIIENFTIFLRAHNGIGRIVYESMSYDTLTPNSSDFKLLNEFCRIKANNKGISYIEHSIISNRIDSFLLIPKSQNISGLQLTDFVIYSLIHNEAAGENKKKDEFTKKVIDHLYNNGYDINEKDLRFYFGLRREPYDPRSIEMIINSNKKLKNSNKGLKKERNHIKNELEQIKITKKKIVDELKDVKQKLEETQNKLLEIKKDIDKQD